MQFSWWPFRIITLTEENEEIQSGFLYDTLGRLIKQTDSNGVVKEYTYDLAGNRLTFVLKKNNVVEMNTRYVYDKLNRLT